MTTQLTLPFDHGIPFEILDSQPDPARAQARIDQAHELAEYFRRDKAMHMRAINTMLATNKIASANRIESPNQ
jgi:hypothetical protein